MRTAVCLSCGWISYYSCAEDTVDWESGFTDNYFLIVTEVPKLLSLVLKFESDVLFYNNAKVYGCILACNQKIF